jgi:hypothetical protein
MTFILICDYVVVEKNAKIAEDKLRAQYLIKTVKCSFTILRLVIKISIDDHQNISFYIYQVLWFSFHIPSLLDRLKNYVPWASDQWPISWTDHVQFGFNHICSF